MMDQLEGEGILLANSKKEKRRERKNEKKRDEKSRKSSDKLPEKKFKSRETIPSCDSDSDFDMEASNPKIAKKVTHSESSDEEATKTKEVKANASIVGAIFKQKKSRESSNPPAGEKKEEKSKVKQSQKDPKESPLKKKKKVSRERSLSFSSSDSWSSPTSASASARKPSSGS